MSKNSNLNKLDIIKEIDSIKKEIDNLKPIKPEMENRILQKFRLDWNYNSNAIEGNSLTFGETQAFLMHGITAKGKPFKDYLDIRGHNEAIDFLLDFVHNNEELTEAVIRELHKIILVESYEIDALTPENKPTKRTVNIGAYKKQPNHVRTNTGQIHYFATPEETPAKMEELVNWYRDSKDKEELHPLIIASLFHHRITAIHPFDDGNGRMARLLMNLILMQYDYPPVVILQNSKENYYAALSQADSDEYLPFVEFVGEYLQHSLNLYLRGAKGENIEELDDLDKELALLKKEIETEHDSLDNYKSAETMKKVFFNTFVPLLFKVENIINKFDDFFVGKSFTMFQLSSFEKTGVIFIDKNSIQNSSGEFQKIVFPTEGILTEISLDGFKSNKNNFDLILKLSLNFNIGKFSINYAIPNAINQNNISEHERATFSSIANKSYKYNSIISDREILSISNEIGKLILDCIKKNTK